MHRRCGYCRVAGHNRQTCPRLGSNTIATGTEQNRSASGKRSASCSYCRRYDAEIKLTISSAIELMRGNKKAHIEIKGDIDFATLISKALKDIEWDYEDDLSKLIGDIPAYQLSKLGKKIVQSTKETSFNIADTFKEYWLEEKPLIAKKRLVEQFNKEVDNLRFDVDRLEQRLKKL